MREIGRLTVEAMEDVAIYHAGFAGAGAFLAVRYKCAFNHAEDTLPETPQRSKYRIGR